MSKQGLWGCLSPGYTVTVLLSLAVDNFSSGALRETSSTRWQVGMMRQQIQEQNVNLDGWSREQEPCCLQQSRRQLDGPLHLGRRQKKGWEASWEASELTCRGCCRLVPRWLWKRNCGTRERTKLDSNGRWKGLRFGVQQVTWRQVAKHTM